MSALVKLLLARIIATFAAQPKDVDGQGLQACTKTPPADDLKTIDDEAIKSLPQSGHRIAALRVTALSKAGYQPCRGHQSQAGAMLTCSEVQHRPTEVAQLACHTHRAKHPQGSVSQVGRPQF